MLLKQPGPLLTFVPRKIKFDPGFANQRLDAFKHDLDALVKSGYLPIGSRVKTALSLPLHCAGTSKIPYAEGISATLPYLSEQVGTQ